MVTLVTDEVKDLIYDGLDGHYGYMAPNYELVKSKRAKVGNASLIDLLASPQVKLGQTASIKVLNIV